MARFENYARDSREIEREIERKCIVLGIDWRDEVQVRALVQEALKHSTDEARLAAKSPVDRKLLAKVGLFGLVWLMLKILEKSARLGIEIRGGEVWNSFVRSLWAETRLRKLD